MNNKIIGIYLVSILLLMTGCGRERKYKDSEIETFLVENLSASEVEKIGYYANEYYCVYTDNNGDKYY